MSSCQDWLSVAPEKDLIKDNYWKKTDDVNSTLAATYSSLRSSSIESFEWAEVRADMLTNFGGTLAYITGGDISTTNKSISWDSYYNTINLANTILYFSQQVMDNDKSFTQRLKDGVDAEALFLRSYNYFNLVRIWKEVPLVLRPSISDTCSIYPAKSSEKVIIKQIIKDLLVAKDKIWDPKNAADAALFSKPEYAKGRANKYAVLALLAEVYLWDEQYQKCIEACDEIINSNIYALLPVDRWFEIYFPGNSSESIFEIQCKDDGTENQINPIYKGGKYANLSTQKVTLSTGYRYDLVFPDQSDIRVCQSYTAAWKYLGISLTSNVTRSANSQRNASVQCYRYSDALLMEAEAWNELNDIEKARSFVSQTAIRAGVAQTIMDGINYAATKEDMRNVILDERAREYVAEGKRWFDLLRAAKRNHFEQKSYVTDVIMNNALSRSRDVLNSKINDTMMYYLPIFYDELKRNKNLTQNPFYER